MDSLYFKGIFSSLDNISIDSSGDATEIEFFPVIKNRFPNFEKLWKLLVVTTTFRAFKLSPLNDPCVRYTREFMQQVTCTPYPVDYDWSKFDEEQKKKPLHIETRPEVSKDVKNIGLAHYSVFLELLYAYRHLSEKNLDYLEDILVHLATIADLVDDLVNRTACLFKKIKGKDCRLKKVTEEEFIEKSRNYYRENYEKDYEHYFNVGKFKSSLKEVLTKSNIPNEFLKPFQYRAQIIDFFGSIRHYRNIIVHRTFVLTIVKDDVHFVPQIEKIGELQFYDDVKNSANNLKKFDSLFIEKSKLAELLFNETLDHLNLLWEFLSSNYYSKLATGNKEILKEFGFE